MIRNYFKVAFRYLLNNKQYSLVNIAGLALGFFCFLLLNFYVSSEKNFDQDAKNVFRLLQIEKLDGKTREMGSIGPRVGTAVKEKFPEVEDVTRLMVLGRLTVGNDPENRQYELVTTIDSKFFSVFNIPFIEGSAETASTVPNGVVLTKELAKKYFGNEQSLNKSFYTNQRELVVAGVIENFSENSHLEGGMLIPDQTAAALFNWWKNFNETSWHRNSSVTYMKLNGDADISSLENKITSLAKENWPADVAFQSNFSLQPVQDIHLYTHEVEGEINKSKGNAFYVRIFFWIAIIVLLVACFNYTGLLNVAFMNRAKEIGVRKVIGAAKSQLLWQFFIESLLLTTVALILAASCLQLAKPLITGLLGTSFDWAYLPTEKIILLIITGLAISLLSILYPTYLISKLTPMDAMRDQTKKKHNFSLQKTMLTFQFVAAITLIACSVLFFRQVRHMQTKEMGFNADGMVIIDINSNSLRNKFEAIKSEFNRLPEVKSVSVTSRVPGEWKNYPIAGVIKEGQQITQAKDMIFIGADEDFTETYNIKLKAGLNFKGVPADSTKILINEAAAEALGLENPVGQFVEIPLINFGGDNNPMKVPFRVQIAAVVGNFHFEDFHQAIRPMIIAYHNNPIHSIDYYSLKVSTDNWSSTLASLKKVNDSFDPENPIEYNILNDKFQRFFEKDILRSRLLIFFTGIIIFICCLGLFAITTYVLRHRTKEIGIRKVLGASVGDLVKLITKDFILLVVLGAVIGIPISWLIMSSWLQEFAYRLPVHWYFFALAAFITMLIAFITVGFKTIKTALSNPVNSLRSE